MPFRLGVLAAVGSSAWGAALSLAAVPIYVSRLGIEAYGLIGFLITTQAILQALDLGLAPAVNREVARSTALGEMSSARTLLRTLGLVYWSTAAALAIVFCLAASSIATLWLGASRLPTPDVEQSLMLMGVLIAARWPVALYQSALIGAQRLGSVSVLSAAMSTLTVGASIVSIVYVSPKLQSLFIVQAAASLLHALLIRAMAWRALGGYGSAIVDLGSLKRIWRFSTGMGGVALTGIALMQLDKALLSRLLPLGEFGEYMLAATAVGGLSVIVAPLFNTIYPKFSALVACRQTESLSESYYGGTRLFAIAFLPIVIALGVYAHDIIWLWTGNGDTAAKVAPVVALLCIGSAINGLMYFPYSLQLAYGLSWVPLLINTVLLAMLAPLVVVLTRVHGGPGGAAAWALLEVLYLFVGTYMTHRHIAVGGAWAWLWKGVALPLLASAAIALALRPLIELAPSGSAAKAVLIAGGVLISPILCAMAFPSMRSRLIARLRARAATPNPA